MRLISFTKQGSKEARIGVRLERQVLDLAKAVPAGEAPLPASMKALLAAGPAALARVRALAAAARAEPKRFQAAMLAVDDISYLPVIPDANKFLCVGKNYRTHLEELKRTDLIKEIPQEPTDRKVQWLLTEIETIECNQSV